MKGRTGFSQNQPNERVKTTTTTKYKSSEITKFKLLKIMKELDTELSQVKKEFKDLKVMFDALADKHEALERKHEECRVVKKDDLKCSICRQ